MTDTANSLQGLWILIIFLLHKKKRKILRTTSEKMYNRAPKVDPVILKKVARLDLNTGTTGSWGKSQAWLSVKNTGAKILHGTTKHWRRLLERPKLSNIFAKNQWQPSDTKRFAAGEDSKDKFDVINHI